MQWNSHSLVLLWNIIRGSDRAMPPSPSSKHRSQKRWLPKAALWISNFLISLPGGWIHYEIHSRIVVMLCTNSLFRRGTGWQWCWVEKCGPASEHQMECLFIQFPVHEQRDVVIRIETLCCVLVCEMAYADGDLLILGSTAGRAESPFPLRPFNNIPIDNAMLEEYKRIIFPLCTFKPGSGSFRVDV